MSQIKLSNYIGKIEEEFKSGQFSQVVAHSRQILKQYPRFISAYRWMGRALLEQKAYSEAENIFQRVLSLDISDFQSHKCLAEIMAETNRLEQAIWHIEHAFEIEPEKSQIISLRDQYYRRAGIASPTVNGMPLASVARLYVRGGIYDQAIEEFTRMLKHNPERLDWKALLAVSYWRIGHNAEALQMSETVLEQLPNNYQARMILGDIWTQNDREDIAELHLELLQNTILLERGQESEYALASQVLQQTERVPESYMVELLSDSHLDDWSALGWGSNREEDTRQSASVSLDELNIEHDVGDAVITESPSADVDELELDQLIQSLEEPPEETLFEFESEDSEDSSLGTGILNSFAAEIEGLSTNGTGPLIDSQTDHEEEDDLDFDWLTSLEDDSLPHEPDDEQESISDSELNKLPDIDSLFTSELSSDSDDNSAEELLEEFEDVDEESLTFLDNDYDSESFDTTEPNDEVEAQSDAIEEDFLADLNFENLDEDVDFLDELSGNQDADIFDWIDTEPKDELETLDSLNEDLNIETEAEPELKLDGNEEIFEELGEIEEIESITSIDSIEESGFTDWLEDVETVSEDELNIFDRSVELSTDLDDIESTTLEDSIVTNSENIEPDSTLNAIDSGLFDFLSSEENQLNVLPSSNEEVDLGSVDSDFDEIFEDTAVEIDGFDFDDKELDVEVIDDEIELEIEEDLFSEISEDDNLSQEFDETDDLFDTSWLDAEPMEEIDVLSDSRDDEVDLKSFAESLEGEFDLLDLEKSETEFDDNATEDQADELELLSDENYTIDSTEDENVETLVEDIISESELDLQVEDNDFTDSVESTDTVEKSSEPELEQQGETDTANELEIKSADDPQTAPVTTATLIDWLMPSDEADTVSEDNSTEDDLSWLSLLENSQDLETNEEVQESTNQEKEWTGDLSAAANAILSPNLNRDDSTQEPENNESPEWLAEVPEYNGTRNIQTTRLQEEPFLDTGPFKATNESEEIEEEDQAEEETLFEDEADLDPVVVRESTAAKLPDWLSDSTESSSLGFEPEVTIESTLEQAETQKAEEVSADDIDEDFAPEVQQTPQYDLSADSASLFSEDDLDMERDEFGNPIPPESQDLEDTLNWLEEIATIDVLGEEPDILQSDMIVNKEKDQTKDVQDSTSQENADPLSDIFSGGSALHAFADLEKNDDQVVAEVEEEGADVSEETLSWLDDLFTPENDQAAGEIPTATWDETGEKVLHAQENIDQDEPDLPVQADAESSDIELIQEEEQKIAEPELIDEEKSSAQSSSMTDFEDFHVSQEEISHAVEFGDEVPGMGDIPEDPEALMAWLELDSSNDDAINTEPSELAGEAESIIESSAEPIAEELEPQQEPEPKKPKSMFGDLDDIRVSEEEISNAVEFGDAVPGMEDIPDDPEALMAWLDLTSDGDDVVDLDVTEPSEDSLIVADMGVEETNFASEANESTETETDALDELFDDIAGVDTDISEEDLIFGDLGTGRLSGSDWLDKMTFDSDPALLGDVPTVPPGTVVTDAEKNIEDILGELNASNNAPVESDSVEELPDDPDEFMKILESNVSESVLDEPEVIEAENAVEFEPSADASDPQADIPEWLQVPESNSDSGLEWLDEASPSGVFNWLESEDGEKDDSASYHPPATSIPKKIQVMQKMIARKNHVQYLTHLLSFQRITLNRKLFCFKIN